jgi:hypothetical protein
LLCTALYDCCSDRNSRFELASFGHPDSRFDVEVRGEHALALVSECFLGDVIHRPAASGERRFHDLRFGHERRDQPFTGELLLALAGVNVRLQVNDLEEVVVGIPLLRVHIIEPDRATVRLVACWTEVDVLEDAPNLFE